VLVYVSVCLRVCVCVFVCVYACVRSATPAFKELTFTFIALRAETLCYVQALRSRVHVSLRWYVCLCVCVREYV